MNDQEATDAFWKEWVEAGKKDKGVKTLVGLSWRDHELYLGGLYVGEVFCIQTTPEEVWRARYMGSSEGSPIGDFKTSDEACDAVEAALRRILMQ